MRAADKADQSEISSCQDELLTRGLKDLPSELARLAGLRENTTTGFDAL